MFERLTTGWQLAKQSASVLRQDKELILFPLFSGLACMLAMASFAVPAYFTGILESFLAEREGADAANGAAQQIMFYVLMFLFYFVTYFIVIFFNSALVACAIIRLKGGNPNLGDGFGAAMARLPQIAGWALVAASVGMILKIIESRSQKVGQIIASVLGMAWSVTTFFVIPILVVEKAGPVDAFKRSVSVMRKTWGESLSANFGIGFFTFIAMFLGIIPLVGGFFLTMSGMAVVGTILIVVGVVLVLLVSLISSALGSIMLAALYIYAEEGSVPSGFDPAMIKGAFATK
ncbi:MAG: DUF6159 family protein [Mariniblastus sp.]